MKLYSVKEIHYTLQGEGYFTGTPSVFVRFTGCNLWTGREEDRGRGAGGCSRWCDTDFVGTDGDRGGRYGAEGLVEAALSTLEWAGAEGPRRAVFTGGEPLLQLDSPLIAAFHEEDFEVCVETNGTRNVPSGVDWVTVSPKAGAPLAIRGGDEVKLVYPQPDGMHPDDVVANYIFTHHFLQPLDGPDRAANTQAAVKYCLENPRWRLSLQTHKLLGIP